MLGFTMVFENNEIGDCNLPLCGNALQILVACFKAWGHKFGAIVLGQ